LSIKNYQNTALAGIEEREWAKSKASHVYTERLQGGINPTVYGLKSPKEFRLMAFNTTFTIKGRHKGCADRALLI